MASNKGHAFIISGEEFSTAPRPRRRLGELLTALPALLTVLVVAAMLIAAYDLLLLALGL